MISNPESTLAQPPNCPKNGVHLSPPSIGGEAESLVADLSSLRGMTREELAGVFPGGEARIEEWHGWSPVYLNFDEAGRLNQLELNLATPKEEVAVTRELRERFGLELPAKYYVKTPGARYYRGMNGPVLTVTYFLENPRKKDFRVSAVAVTYKEL